MSEWWKKNSISTADLYARLTDEERADLSDEERAKVYRLIAIEERHGRYIHNTMTTVGIILLALLVLYTGGGGMHGRYAHDIYEFMYEN